MFFSPYLICKYMKSYYNPSGFPAETSGEVIHKNKSIRKVCRILVVGKTCGKTALLMRMIDNKYKVECLSATMGIEFWELNYKDVQLRFWEIAVSENMGSTFRSYFEDTNFVIVCGYARFDTDNVKYWINKALEWAPKNTPIICVETIIDLIKDVASKKWRRQIEQEYKQKYPGLKYFRVSAKTGQGVDVLKNYLQRFTVGNVNILRFALTCKEALLQIKEIAEGNFSGTNQAIPKWPPGVIRHMLSFLGDQYDCKKVVVNTPSLNKITANVKKI